MNGLKLMLRVTQGMFLRNQPGILVYFVTSRCNARCNFCFNLDNVIDPNKPPEITLDDVEKIARSLYPLPQLLLSGGEPFLKKDVSDLVRKFYEHAGTRQISIPTNGALPHRILPQVEKMLEDCPKAFLNINLSVDAIGEAHDVSRKIPGCFDKIVETYGLLAELRAHHPQMSINVLSTVKSDNAETVPGLIDWIKEHFDANYHFATLVRGDVDEEELDFDLLAAEDKLRELYASRGGINRLPVANRIAPAVSQLMNKTILQARRQKERAFHCLAGRKIVVLSPDGLLYPCEPLWLEPETRPGDTEADDYMLARLSDFDFDVKKALASRRAQGIKDWIDEEKCSCCYGCATMNSVIYSPRMHPKLLKEMLT